MFQHSYQIGSVDFKQKMLRIQYPDNSIHFELLLLAQVNVGEDLFLAVIQFISYFYSFITRCCCLFLRYEKAKLSSHRCFLPPGYICTLGNTNSLMNTRSLALINPVGDDCNLTIPPSNYAFDRHLSKA